MLENNGFERIHYSRFIASWNNVAGNYDKREDRNEFRAWLKTLIINGKKMPESVIREICDLKSNGMLELEESARKYKSDRKINE